MDTNQLSNYILFSIFGNHFINHFKSVKKIQNYNQYTIPNCIKIIHSSFMQYDGSHLIHSLFIYMLGRTINFIFDFTNKYLFHLLFILSIIEIFLNIIPSILTVDSVSRPMQQLVILNN